MTDLPEPGSEPAAPWARPLLAGALALVLACLISLVVLAVVVQRSDEPDLDQARDEVMAVTTDFVVRINTFGPDDLDAQGRLADYVPGVKELMTAKFGASFDDARQYPESLVSQAKYARTCEVNAVAVSTLGDDSATVLAAWQQIDSYPSPENPKQRVDVLPRPVRWKVALRKIEGEWLVDEYEVVAEQEGAAPSVPPTGQPAPSPTRPSGQPSGTGGGNR